MADSRESEKRNLSSSSTDMETKKPKLRGDSLDITIDENHGPSQISSPPIVGSIEFWDSMAVAIMSPKSRLRAAIGDIIKEQVDSKLDKIIPVALNNVSSCYILVLNHSYLIHSSFKSTLTF